MRKIFSLNILLILFLILSGCGKEIRPPFIPSAEPTDWQIKNSAFFQFTEKLNPMCITERQELVKQFLEGHTNGPVIEGDSLICFFWYGKADTVLLNGDLQSGWAKPDTMKFINCGEENFFFRICTAPPDSRLDYLFIVDGQTTTDPLNQRITPSGYGPHSEVIVPKFIPDAVRNFRTNIPHGSVDSILFVSREKEIPPRPVKIYKPSGYDTLSVLPSLYVMDGFKALEFMDYVNVLDNLIADKRIRPVIAVFLDYVDGDNNLYLTNNEQLTKILCSELVPLIDRRYKTNTHPQYRAITGISAGGHFSLITAFNRHDIFLNAAGQSTTLTEELLDVLNAASGSGKPINKYKIYFDVGVYDLTSGTIEDHTFLTANRKLSDEIKNAGFNFRYREFNDGHQWANWRERTDDILIYFFPLSH
jgi:enterochelin esterase family protein